MYVYLSICSGSVILLSTALLNKYKIYAYSFTEILKIYFKLLH